MGHFEFGLSHWEKRIFGVWLIAKLLIGPRFMSVYNHRTDIGPRLRWTDCCEWICEMISSLDSLPSNDFCICKFTLEPRFIALNARFHALQTLLFTAICVARTRR